MPGIGRMLDALADAGIAVGVVSAAEAGVVEKEIRALDLEGRFAFVVGSASPKREALAGLTEARGAERVAYLGDTEHDVEEALAAGVMALGFGGGTGPKGRSWLLGRTARCRTCERSRGCSAREILGS